MTPLTSIQKISPNYEPDQLFTNAQLHAKLHDRWPHLVSKTYTDWPQRQLAAWGIAPLGRTRKGEPLFDAQVLTLLWWLFEQSCFKAVEEMEAGEQVLPVARLPADLPPPYDPNAPTYPRLAST